MKGALTRFKFRSKCLAAIAAEVITTHKEHCMSFAEAYVPTGPRITINGVQYEISYGEGLALEVVPWSNERVPCPVYVWRSVDEPDYTAPQHVSLACDERYELSCMIEQAERSAGWSMTP